MQERLTKGEDFFLQQLSILISHLNTAISRLNILEEDVKSYRSIVERIEDKIDLITHSISQKINHEVK